MKLLLIAFIIYTAFRLVRLITDFVKRKDPPSYKDVLYTALRDDELYHLRYSEGVPDRLRKQASEEIDRRGLNFHPPNP